MWLAKASLLFQLIHILTPVKFGAVCWACHTLIWGNLIFYVCTFFSTIFACHTVWEGWNPSYQGHCINRNMTLVVSSAIDLFSSLMILLFPIWAMGYLQIAPKRIAGVIPMLVIGIL